MHMAVDQAGHQGSAAQIDNLRICRGSFTLGTHCYDPFALDHAFLPRDQSPLLQVQQTAVAQNQAGGISGTHG
ncbi:hypothetical protein ALO99_200127 [Pseudomonas coronafaciens pv. porri]|nr:hypothetical protein ALO99_200127 [Pseudomonas coronafaciens pv. porri]